MALTPRQIKDQSGEQKQTIRQQKAKANQIEPRQFYSTPVHNPVFNQPCVDCAELV